MDWSRYPRLSGHSTRVWMISCFSRIICLVAVAAFRTVYTPTTYPTSIVQLFLLSRRWSCEAVHFNHYVGRLHMHGWRLKMIGTWHSTRHLCCAPSSSSSSSYWVGGDA
ncbi:hypothetical protein F5B20DRAFT_90550 [Whalleya microplaca]|nr:hypothetical protein F5B20DRAFT_90550 [Whalleya microplaca]